MGQAGQQSLFCFPVKLNLLYLMGKLLLHVFYHQGGMLFLFFHSMDVFQDPQTTGNQCGKEQKN